MSADKTTPSKSPSVKRTRKRAKKSAGRALSVKATENPPAAVEDPISDSGIEDEKGKPGEPVQNEDTPATIKVVDASRESAKRGKRRRRKGTGGAAADTALTGDSDDAGLSADDAVASGKQRASQPPAKADPQQLAKFAWRIFLAEVSEEGVALIGDSDARELARRCFRLAEIFIGEQMRRG